MIRCFRTARQESLLLRVYHDLNLDALAAIEPPRDYGRD
jgi:hypothetical protein